MTSLTLRQETQATKTGRLTNLARNLGSSEVNAPECSMWSHLLCGIYSHKLKMVSNKTSRRGLLTACSCNTSEERRLKGLEIDAASSQLKSQPKEKALGLSIPLRPFREVRLSNQI